MAEMKQQDIIVPDLGGHSQSKVIEVIVGVGDEVEIDQGLITLESEKAAMEVPSPYAGMIESVSVKAGDTVSPGDVIVSIKTRRSSTH